MEFNYGQELKEYNRFYKEFDGLYHELAQKAGLSDSAFLILYTLAEFGGGCLQKDIADFYGISKQTINSSIKNLETRGILSLQKGKRRELHLYLTQEGQKLVEEKIVPIVKMENRIFAEMGPEESRELLRLMRKLVSLYRKQMQG